MHERDSTATDEETAESDDGEDETADEETTFAFRSESGDETDPESNAATERLRTPRRSTCRSSPRTTRARNRTKSTRRIRRTI